MDQSIINNKIKKLITINNSSEYKNAKKLTTEFDKLQKEIKEHFQNNPELKRASVEVDDKTFILYFDIREQQRLDTTIIPKEIKEEYTKIAKIYFMRIHELD